MTLPPKPKGLLWRASPTEVEWDALAPLSVDGIQRRCQSFVYFIAEDEGCVKIGSATNPIARRRALQCGNPRLLRLRRAIYGDQITERLLHDAFEDERLVLPGAQEWYPASIAPLILTIAAEIAERQIDEHIHADMDEMTAIVTDVLGELGRTKVVQEEMRFVAAGVGYVKQKAK